MAGRAAKPSFHCTPYRSITISAKASSDPYYILGVDRQTPFAEVKKVYFKQAKKYHPDLNPDNEKAKKMFLLMGEAYR